MSGEIYTGGVKAATTKNAILGSLEVKGTRWHPKCLGPTVGQKNLGATSRAFGKSYLHAVLPRSFLLLLDFIVYVLSHILYASQVIWDYVQTSDGLFRVGTCIGAWVNHTLRRGTRRDISRKGKAIGISFALGIAIYWCGLVPLTAPAVSMW